MSSSRFIRENMWNFDDAMNFSWMAGFWMQQVPIFLELIFVTFELLLEVSGLLLAASEASRLAP